MKMAVVLVVFLATALAVTQSPSLAQLIERPIPGDPVQLDSGKLAGKLLDSGVKAYLGIPYVAPPLYANRWRDPQPVQAWQGVYYAGRIGPMCQQVQRQHNINHFFGSEAVSEDCLYMNIWAPADAEPGDNRPVIVFIYGGGLRIGSSGMANYAGESIAEKGAIFVNFNYRVGALGFMAHPELSAESPHHTSGNYGFLDQITALQWIQRNIANFGGDPRHVLISGQSAGSRSVSVLTASPLAKGLFSATIGMSGSVVTDFGQGNLPTLEEMEASGVELLEVLGVKDIAEARLLAPDTIAAAQHSVSPHGAAIDGYVLPRHPTKIYAAHQQNDVPMIMGFMRDESRNQLARVNSIAELRTQVRAAYPQAASEVLAMYPVETDAEASRVGAQMAREARHLAGMRAWAVAQTETGNSPAYLMMFSRVHPYTAGITFADHDPSSAGAYHTGEVPYWFDTLDAYNMFRTTRDWAAYDRRLANMMSDILIAFARTGDPSIPHVTWPRMTLRDQTMLEIGGPDVGFRVLPLQSTRIEFMGRLGPAPRQATPNDRDDARD